MNIDVVLGLQWGDEGKGKIVDVLASSYPVVARFQGGPNAGHSLNFDGMKFVLHTIPSGIFREGSINLIGNGVVIDPVILREECEALEKVGVPVSDRLFISKKAHFILPTHRALDAASEAAKGKQKIGSTLKGIGPTYMDKTGRNGLRVGDSLSSDFMSRYSTLKEKHCELLRQYGYTVEDMTEREAVWFEAVEYMKRFRFVDGEYFINELAAQGKKILAEGAQGTLLDIDFGSYPFVTSSSTVCAGACTGLGIAPSAIKDVYGIFKAYCTRVGSGPFPTELFDETGEELRKKGFEFGATTGRPRRTGWLDLVALKYAVMLDGVTALIMMKSDVMDGFEEVKAAVAYKVDGVVTDHVPYDTYAEVEPVYRTFKGWTKSLSACRNESELPAEFMDYVKFIEEFVGVPVRIISVGPDRTETIIR